jgi:DNA (cytosine-5)-methyltransferase 1
MNEIKVLDLFSGIGGFSLGLERAGPFRTVAFCEQDAFCQAVLKKHWPEIPIFEDVRNIPANDLGSIDLICGGPPCQPWSQSGKKLGIKDDRDLWPEMVAVIADLRPRWVIVENVSRFVDDRMGLQRCLADLDSIGMQAATFVIPAFSVGAPHRRYRCFIVSNAERMGQGSRAASIRRQKRHGAVGHTERAPMADADLDGQQTERAAGGPIRQNERHDPVRSGAETDGQRNFKSGLGGDLFDGVPGWMDEPNISRIQPGVEFRVERLRAIGNAVIPAIVEQIGRAIMSANRDPA